jgi:hypothetical protein
MALLFVQLGGFSFTAPCVQYFVISVLALSNLHFISVSAYLPSSA